MNHGRYATYQLRLAGKLSSSIPLDFSRRFFNVFFFGSHPFLIFSPFPSRLGAPMLCLAIPGDAMKIFLAELHQTSLHEGHGGR